MKLIEKTVLVEVPGPFTDDEADVFVARMDEALDEALDASARGVLDAVRSDHVPLADVARVTVS